MKRLGLLLVLCALIQAPAYPSEGDSQSGQSADVAAVRALTLQTTEAFNKHDAKAWASVCTPDAQLVTVRGESMKGGAEIERGLAKIFETRGRAAKLKTKDIAVRFIRPDVALVHVLNEMSGVTSMHGTLLPPHKELSIRILVKDHDTWRITAFHNTIVQK